MASTQVKRPPRRSKQLVSIDILRAEHRLAQVEDDSMEAAELRRILVDLWNEYAGAKAA